MEGMEGLRNFDRTSQMKISMGNHARIQAAKHLRQKVREFYLSILDCKSLPAPSPAMELFEFADGFIFGVYFVDEGEYLTDPEQLKGTWLELKTDQPEKLKQRVLAFGVTPIDYLDKSHFYFQAPGGQAFRIA